MPDRSMLQLLAARATRTLAQGHRSSRFIARRRALLPRFASPVFGPGNVIGNAQIGKRLAEHFQLKERSPITSIAPEVQPVVLVHDATIPEKNEMEQWVGDGFALNAVAGQVHYFGINNQITGGGNTGVFLKPQRMWLSTSETANSQNVRLSVVDSSVPSAGFTPELLNKYNSGLGKAGFMAYSGIPGSTPHGLSMGVWTLAPFVHLEIDLQGIVIPPGKALLVDTDVVNVQTACSIWWIEVPEQR